MATKAPEESITGTIFASNAVAELWQRAKAQRHDVLRPATDIMLNLANVRPGYRVLDVAAGTGDQTLMAARLVGSTGYVLAIDSSPNMLNIAADELRNSGLTNVETQVMDAENIQRETDSFDAVICRMGLMLFPNPVKSLSEMHRVVKPTGKVAALVWSTEDKNPYRGIPLAIVRRIGSKLTEVPGLRLLFSLGNPAVLEEIFSTVGFADVVVHPVPIRWCFPSIADAIRALKDSFPGLQHLIAQLSETQRALVWTEIEQQLKQFECQSGFEAPGEVLIGVGAK